METNTSNSSDDPKSAYEARKAERESLRSASGNSVKRKKILKSIPWYILSIVIVAGIAYAIWLGVKARTPEGPDRSATFPSLGQEHIDVGAPHPEYNSNPPTSGWHYGVTARTGFRESEIPDEHIVHNLEHGEIWISFKPDISEEVKDQLKDFAGPMVIVTPRASNDADIAVAAWTRLDKFNIENGTLDAQRIRDFINRYVNKGPEVLPPNAHGTGV